MTSIFDIKKACAFTGPRPEKIFDNIDEIKYHLEIAIISAINDGYTSFLSGMSRGFDMLAAQTVLSLQSQFDIDLISVIPFLDQNISWSDEDKNLYNEILAKSRFTFCISDIFFPSVYFKRNKFLINNCSKVITYYKNSEGGTKYTLDYAAKTNLPITNIANTQLTF